MYITMYAISILLNIGIQGHVQQQEFTALIWWLMHVLAATSDLRITQQLIFVPA